MKRCMSFILVLLLVFTLMPFSASAASSMKASGDIIEYIKSKEGLRLEAYKLEGEDNWTIGYGHSGPDVKQGDKLENKEAADKLFAEDLKKYEAAVNGYIDKYNLSFNQGQFDAIVSLTYNCGTNWVNNNWRIAKYLKNNFKDSNGKAIPDQEIADAFGVICSGGTGIMEGLIKRRIDEAKMFLYGDYDGTGKNDFVYVILDANGGTLTAGNRVVIYTKGQHYSSMPDATRSGYYLDGWKSDNGYYYGNGDIAKKNLTLKAIWLSGTGPTKYTVTVNDGFGSGKNKPGAKVYLSPYEKEGYRFTGWTKSTDVTISKDSDGFYYFTMPSKSVTLTANYEKIKTSYTVTVNNGGGSGTFEVGSKVCVYPLSTEEKFGYKISSWKSDEVTVQGNASSGFYFTMPSKNVTVTGVYVKGCNRFESCPSLDYRDISETHWAHYEIDYCIESGLLIGTDTNTFAPDDPMTNAMIATVLYRIDGNPSVGNAANPYSDVYDEYYKDAAIWMYDKGMDIDGEYGLFNPDDTVSRQEFAYLLFKYSGSKAPGDADLSAFSDSGNVDAQYLDAMNWAVSQGIIIGTDEGTLEPQAGATRAEICTMLYRYLHIMTAI